MSISAINQPVVQLRETLQVLSTAVERVISEWEQANNSPNAKSHGPDRNVSYAEYDAVKTVVAAIGTLESLVVDPHERLINLSTSYAICRAIHIIAKHNIAELLDKAGENGVHAVDLARSTGLEEKKLCRIMRALTSYNIFQEVEQDCFANNHISQVLADDIAFRSFILMKGQVHYTASDFFPDVLSDTVIGHSYDTNKTAFQQAVGTKLSLFQWMNQLVPISDTNWRPVATRQHPWAGKIQESCGIPSRVTLEEEMVHRPEKTLFNLAMAGLGRGTGNYYMHDFPWKDLGNGTVVDVGGGIGSFCMQLHEVYPKLDLVVQDTGPMIQHAHHAWKAKHPSAIANGQVNLAVHDFFKKNPVVGAEIYWLRHIIHDWSDDKCITILSRIAESMTPKSRVLIAEIVINTTLGCNEVKSAPKPLLANYGQAMSNAHIMDLSMMMMMNGRERTPIEFQQIIKAAGLVLVKIWECRGPLSIIECRLP